MTLAAVAIALKVLVPPGFMLATDARSDVVPIVLCTAYGAKVVHIDADQAPPSDDDHGGKTPHDAACAFTGHAASPLTPVAAPFAYAGVALPAHRFDAPSAPAPGRGLAAPPPPSQAPPFRI
ncbi:hypothetical protein H8B08_16145 [Caulobacter sp. 17J80-11]|nr:hypothetical protein [Caulobacter sp. 17J80-11]